MKPKTVSVTNPWSLDVVVLHAMTLSLVPEASTDVVEPMDQMRITKTQNTVVFTTNAAPAPAPQASSSAFTPRSQRAGYDASKWCKFCRVKGHDYDECRSKNNRTQTRSQDATGQIAAMDEEEMNMIQQLPSMNKQCYFCGEKGHVAAMCLEMKRYRDAFMAKKESGDTPAKQQ